MQRWHTLATAAAALIGAAGLSVALSSGDSTDQEIKLVAVQSAATGDPQYTFTVSATPVADLYPGAVRHLRITLTNPFAFALKVTGVRAELVSTSKAGCAPIAENLEVQSYTGALPERVTAKDSAEVGSVPLHMPNSVANACQEATFTIALHADATRDGQ